MREIRPSGSEGGVARKRHPYPYQALREVGTRVRRREAPGVRRIPPLLRSWCCQRPGCAGCGPLGFHRLCPHGGQLVLPADTGPARECLFELSTTVWPRILAPTNDAFPLGLPNHPDYTAAGSARI